ncbi:hypothetical protein CDEST_06171 [Colletotrichum destructivum]|uniref:Uncharacterized protein n=1 Tax=Colletotrichum destructivum TaxID=34406 RepID=A0AAX4ICT2_9PEZI|nr:hypothetical protein CDEST_06171 [Colletotrichum destructivum]
MKLTLAFLLTVVAATASAASVDVGLVNRQQSCLNKGTSCGPQSPTDPEGPPCCSGLTCRSTFAPVGGNGKVCQ